MDYVAKGKVVDVVVDTDFVTGTKDEDDDRESLANLNDFVEVVADDAAVAAAAAAAAVGVVDVVGDAFWENIVTAVVDAADAVGDALVSVEEPFLPADVADL